MKIKARTEFLHGRQRFEADKLYEVPEGPGYYLCANGWAEDVTGEAPTGEPGTEPVTLQIDSVALGHDAPKVEG